MAQPNIEISQLAEQAWWAITGGTVSSYPKKPEVELAVRELASYWGQAGMYEKYKIENQWDSGEGYLVPFYDLNLVAYPADVNFKKLDLFAIVKPMDLPKGRGLAKVTYNSRGREVKVGRLTLSQRLQQERTLGTSLISEYFFSWEGPNLIIRSSCPEDKVKLDRVNIYPIIINSTNAADGLRSIIISKVTERFRGYAPKDMISDQNPTVLG